MRSHSHAGSAFLGGVVVGLGLASVALWRIGPDRSARHRRASTERASFIDGVHPPNPAELHARPPEELNVRVRLESEAVDVVPTSQRW
jgi:hypothetical protein